MLRLFGKWLPTFRKIVMLYPSRPGSPRTVFLLPHAIEEVDYSESVPKGDGTTSLRKAGSYLPINKA
jgi:hypothetical protein